MRAHTRARAHTHTHTHTHTCKYYTTLHTLHIQTHTHTHTPEKHTHVYPEESFDIHISMVTSVTVQLPVPVKDRLPCVHHQHILLVAVLLPLLCSPSSLNLLFYFLLFKILQCPVNPHQSSGRGHCGSTSVTSAICRKSYAQFWSKAAFKHRQNMKCSFPVCVEIQL